MALNSKLIAPFIGASVLAGEGEYDEIVKACVAELAEALELNDLDDIVSQEVTTLAQMDDEQFNDYLSQSAEKIVDKEAVLVICLDVLASDLIISIDEMANYFAFADILGISEERASEIFDDFVEAIDDLVIEDEN